MSTKRDLVEAHGFNRRRLVTAFVSGAPGGREVEPVRHGRTVIGGIVLALLVVAGAAVSGFLQKPPPDDWDQQSIVIGKESGSRFYAYEGQLFPVINTTSAKLLLGEDATPLTIGDDVIAEKDTGPAIGIAGAPEVLPAASRLAEDGWLSCTNAQGGIRTSIGYPGASRAADGEALLVSAEGSQWLLVGALRYAVADDEQGRLLLRRLGLADVEPVPVTGLWLSLFFEGSPLEVPDLAATERQVDTGVAALRRVGTPVQLDSGTYVLDADGRLLPTSAFSHAVLQTEIPVVTIEGAGADQVPIEPSPQRPAYPSDWPEDAVTPYTQPQAPCVRMDVGQRTLPRLTLATASESDLLAEGDTIDRDVLPGRGAVVRAVSGGVLDAGNVYLVDGAGTAFPVGADADGSTLPQLGYASYDPRPVPQAWLGVLGSGPALSTTAAASLPVVQEQQS